MNNGRDQLVPGRVVDPQLIIEPGGHEQPAVRAKYRLVRATLVGDATAALPAARRLIHHHLVGERSQSEGSAVWTEVDGKDRAECAQRGDVGGTRGSFEFDRGAADVQVQLPLPVWAEQRLELRRCNMLRLRGELVRG